MASASSGRAWGRIYGAGERAHVIIARRSRRKERSEIGARKYAVSISMSRVGLRIHNLLPTGFGGAYSLSWSMVRKNRS